MIGDNRNGEHHEQQEDDNCDDLRGLGGRPACDDIRVIWRDRTGDAGHESRNCGVRVSERSSGELHFRGDRPFGGSDQKS